MRRALYRNIADWEALAFRAVETALVVSQWTCCRQNFPYWLWKGCPSTDKNSPGCSFERYRLLSTPMPRKSHAILREVKNWLLAKQPEAHNAA